MSPVGSNPERFTNSIVSRSAFKLKQGTKEQSDAFQVLIHETTCVQRHKNVFLQTKR